MQELGKMRLRVCLWNDRFSHGGPAPAAPEARDGTVLGSAGLCSHALSWIQSHRLSPSHVQPHQHLSALPHKLIPWNAGREAAL